MGLHIVRKVNPFLWFYLQHLGIILPLPNGFSSATSDTDAQHGEFPPNNAPGIRDTGTVIRAFLPIKAANGRNRLMEYHGFGTAVGARVVCMRPKLTNVSFTTGDGYRVSGLADIEHEPLGLLRQAQSQGSNDFSLSFDCGLALATPATYLELEGWPLSL